jgi:hypothetical protein
MTRDAVQAAIRELQEAGQPVSVRKVRKRLGGGSFSTVLQFMKNQEDTPDDQPSDPAYRRMVDLAEAIEQALAEGHVQVLGELIGDAEARRAGCMMALLAAGARGEPMGAWSDAYQRLQAAIAEARGRLAAQASKSRGAQGWLR